MNAFGCSFFFIHYSFCIDIAKIYYNLDTIKRVNADNTEDAFVGADALRVEAETRKGYYGIY